MQQKTIDFGEVLCLNCTVLYYYTAGDVPKNGFFPESISHMMRLKLYTSAFSLYF